MKNQYSIDRIDFGDITLNSESGYIRFAIQKGKTSNYIVTVSTTIPARLNDSVAETITQYFVAQLNNDKIYKIDKPIVDGNVVEGIPTEINNYIDKQKILNVLPDFNSVGPNVYDIFLIIGQSNAVGTNTGPILIPGVDDTSPDVLQIGSGVDFGNYSLEDGEIGLAQHPLQHPAQLAHDTDFYEVDGQTQMVGLGIAFAKRYIELNPGRTVLLIPAAEGGTALHDGVWKKGGERYEDAISKVNSAIAAGHRFMGAIWWQGEHDSEDANALPLNTAPADSGRRYPVRVTDMIANMRLDIDDDGFDTNGYLDKPFFIVQLTGQFLVTYAGAATSVINQFQEGADDAGPSLVPILINTGTDWVIDNSDTLNVHVDASTSRALGTEIANVYNAGDFDSSMVMRVRSFNNEIFDDYGSTLTVAGTGQIDSVTDGVRSEAIEWSDSNTGLLTDTRLPITSTGYTKMCWFKGTFTGGAMNFISSIDSNLSHAFSYLIQGTHNGDITLDPLNPSVVDGDWHHVAITWDGSSTFETYVDGAASSSFGFTDHNADETPLDDRICIGAFSDNNGVSYSNGVGDGRRMDDIRVYNRPLTDLEILGIFFVTSAPLG